MMSLALLFRLFLVGWALNFLYELCHSQLYQTCRQQSWQKNMPLLLKMSLKDGLFIVLFYSISVLIFGSRNILHHAPQLMLFIGLSLVFAFVDETVSLRLRRWEYAPAMPLLLGVGITPLLEIALTGIASFIIVFGF